MIFFFLTFSCLMYSLLYFPFQSTLIENITSTTTTLSSSSSSSSHSSSSSSSTTSSLHIHKKLSSKYLIEYHNWMNVLNNSLPIQFSKIFEVSTTTSSNLPSLISSTYNQGTPFPHLILDSLIPSQILHEVIKEFPDNPVIQKVNDNIHHHGQIKLRNPESYGPATAALYTYLQSPLVISYLERLTGINGLVAGDHSLGSGLHQTLPGGYLDIHADYNRPKGLSHEQNRLHRRLNFYIFLNPDWDPKYGGYLEFWPRDLSYCQQRILPKLGRSVIFSSTDYTYHGHPQKLTCPKDRSRRSLTMYYYTSTKPPADDCIHPNCLHDKKQNNFIKIKCKCGEKYCGDQLIKNEVVETNVIDLDEIS